MLAPQKLSAVVAPSDSPSTDLITGVVPKASPASDLVSTSPRPPQAISSSKFLSEVSGIGAPNTRYTTTKFRDYDHYCATTSVWRRMLVIILTPIPSILTSLLPPLIPLQKPNLGVLHNTGFIIHSFVTLVIVMYGSVFQVHAPLQLSLKEMPIFRGLLVAIVGTAQLTALVTLVGYVWRFPVPFSWINAYPPYLVLLIWAHFLVLGPKMRHNMNLKQHFVAFFPSHIAQASQVVVYPVFSALFEISSQPIQILLALLFPALKHIFRRVVYIITRRFPNDAEAEAVSGVEICSVMYQTMIMQSAPSPITTGILMGIDVVQGLFSVYILMKTPSSIRQREVIGRARHILCVEGSALTENELATYETVMRLPRLSKSMISAALTATSRKSKVGVQRTAPKEIRADPRRSMISPSNDAETVTHALEAIQAAESIALVEYFEVVIPIASIIYITWASRFPSAVYNPKIRPYYDSSDHLGLAVRGLVLYTVLQTMSLMFLEVILWHRYRVSAMKLLAFVLERHMWSVQGKLISWLTLNFQFPVVHYGIDFTFKFDYSNLPLNHSPP